MIPPKPSGSFNATNRVRKKRRPKAPLFIAFPAISERVLYAKADRGHVRASRNSARSAVVIVPRRAGDVEVVREQTVVDLGVGGIHLGALGHDIVVAEHRHLRYPIS